MGYQKPILEIPYVVNKVLQVIPQQQMLQVLKTYLQLACNFCTNNTDLNCKCRGIFLFQFQNIYLGVPLFNNCTMLFKWTQPFMCIGCSLVPRIMHQHESKTRQLPSTKNLLMYMISQKLDFFFWCLVFSQQKKVPDKAILISLRVCLSSL